jgi:hypothetical protein
MAVTGRDPGGTGGQPLLGGGTGIGLGLAGLILSWGEFGHFGCLSLNL